MLIDVGQLVVWNLYSGYTQANSRNFVIAGDEWFTPLSISFRSSKSMSSHPFETDLIVYVGLMKESRANLYNLDLQMGVDSSLDLMKQSSNAKCVANIEVRLEFHEIFQPSILFGES